MQRCTLDVPSLGEPVETAYVEETSGIISQVLHEFSYGFRDQLGTLLRSRLYFRERGTHHPTPWLRQQPLGVQTVVSFAEEGRSQCVCCGSYWVGIFML